MREIRITVSSDGTTRTDFTGYAGSTCLDAAAQLKALLAAYGVRVEQTDFIAKPELTQAEVQPQTKSEVQYEQ